MFGRFKRWLERFGTRRGGHRAAGDELEPAENEAAIDRLIESYREGIDSRESAAEPEPEFTSGDADAWQSYIEQLDADATGDQDGYRRGRQRSLADEEFEEWHASIGQTDRDGGRGR